MADDLKDDCVIKEADLSEIVKAKGIEKKRLNDIMNVIEKYIGV